MEIKKVTDKYSFSKAEDNTYVVGFGEVKKAEDKSVVVEITGVKEAGLVSLKVTCGCTTTDKMIIDPSTVRFKVSYNSCDINFTKTVIVLYNNKQVTKILLKGQCRQ